MSAIPTISRYRDLYNYLVALNEDQIIKLRKIATGILSLSAFSIEEIIALEERTLFLRSH